jgi:hypothetical protein
MQGIYIMFTQEEFEKIVTSQIEHDEELGTLSGGSDHIGYKSYGIEEILPPRQVGKGWEVTYRYVTITETEFTIYPDNPPYENSYEKTILLDKAGNVIKESEIKFLGSLQADDISDWIDTMEP